MLLEMGLSGSCSQRLPLMVAFLRCTKKLIVVGVFSLNIWLVCFVLSPLCVHVGTISNFRNFLNLKVTCESAQLELVSQSSN